MNLIRNFDILIAIGLVVLLLYGIKNYSDRRKREEERENNLIYSFHSDRRSDYLKWKRHNRTVSFFAMPFLIAIIYIVLRLNGTIGNPFL